MTPENFEDKLRKLKALAERGIDGERETAQRKLEAFVRNCGVTTPMSNLLDAIEQPDTGARDCYWFKWHDEWDKQLVIHCYCKIATTWTVLGRKCKHQLGFELTQRQYLNMATILDYYRREWRMELEELFDAFTRHHDIRPPQDPAAGVLDSEASARLLRRMESLTSKTFDGTKRLKTGRRA